MQVRVLSPPQKSNKTMKKYLLIAKGSDNAAIKGVTIYCKTVEDAINEAKEVFDALQVVYEEIDVSCVTFIND